jgi:SSS family solute:Na+ symporter
MAPLDWIIVSAYLLGSVLIGLWFTRRARNSKDDYLLAGRSLGWFMAGTSIVATTYSSDTPLFVSRITRETGIFENWWWWSSAIGQLAAVFFFARLWRRSEVTTDVEFVSKRYEPSVATNLLRIGRGAFDGVFVNCVIAGSVTLGMLKVLTTVLNLSDQPLFELPLIGGVTAQLLLLLVLASFTLLYTLLAGLYGVVYTDVFQFLLAMLGSVALAVICYVDASKGPGLLANLAAAPHFKESLLGFFPRFAQFDLTTFAFFVYVGMMWWFSAPSGSFYVQRMLSTKNEGEAAKAFLWYNVCQYVLRPWPWIIVGLVSLIYFPDLKGPDAENAYPAMVSKFLPLGLKGIMVASLMAAYMSTVSSHLHLGVSYLVNDIYQPYLVQGRSQRHYVIASQIGMLALSVVAVFITTQLKGITEVYKFLAVYWCGMGTVLIARWYWWRVNAWTEVTALATSIGCIFALHTEAAGGALIRLCEGLGLLAPGAENPDLMTVRVALTTVVVTTAWIAAALWTGSKEPPAKTLEFYRKLRVPGPGWARVARLVGIEPVRGELGRGTAAWLVSIVWLYSSLLGIGALLFHQWLGGALLLTLALGTGWWVLRYMRSLKV